MISKLHNRLGTAGLVVAVVALVAALAGVAVAAGGLTKQQEKQVVKIAKKHAGKQGPMGPAGPQGPAGAPGAKGDKGDPGTNGTNGKSATVTEIEPGEPQCAELGGAEVKQEEAGSGVEVCNGSPWTAGGTLPQGATETGTWSTGARTAAGGNVEVAIGFPIPIGSELGVSTASEPNAPNQVHYIFLNGTGEPKEKFINWTVPAFEEVTSTACTGTAREPTASPGNLCIYEDVRSNVEEPVSNQAILKVGTKETEKGAAKVGAILKLEATGAGGFAFGSWAATAP